jgi:hypothetical protein
MRTFLPVITFLSLACSALVVASELNKSAATKALLSVVNDLETLASRQTGHYPAGKFASKIDTLIDTVTAIDQLERLALICYAVEMPGAAQDAAHDGVFDYAKWECARHIARTGGSDAATALAHLRPIIGSDGGDSLRMKALIAAQAKIQKKQ